jgi:hypothetical protein
VRAYRHGLGPEQAVDEDGAEGGQRHPAPDGAEPCDRAPLLVRSRTTAHMHDDLISVTRYFVERYGGGVSSHAPWYVSAG